MTFALVAYVAVCLTGIGLLIRWEVRRTPLTFAERMKLMVAAMREAERVIGETFVPALKRAGEAMVEFGDALRSANSR